jgi:hypothetical protein
LEAGLFLAAVVEDVVDTSTAISNVFYEVIPYIITVLTLFAAFMRKRLGEWANTKVSDIAYSQVQPHRDALGLELGAALEGTRGEVVGRQGEILKDLAEVKAMLASLGPSQQPSPEEIAAAKNVMLKLGLEPPEGM